ncbi:MAG TPA: hypothetical protein VLE69_00630, partial [Candidatus Saccharimonadales bacterium]|nr:hypothetical protein [Candidatus Saccharimonadales bacterium]
MSGRAIYRFGEALKRKKDRLFTKKFLPVLLVSLGLAGTLGLSAVFGAPPPASSVNIEQCANGPAAGPFNICKKLSGNDGYVTGSVNATKAHWQEGDFLPYRALIEAPNSGAQQIQVSFDTAKSSELKHAIDYLSSYSLTETTGSASSTHANQANPCGDFVSGCSPAGPFVNGTAATEAAIPVPSSLTTGYPTTCANGSFGGTETTGFLRAWVSTGTISNLSVNIGAPTTSGDCPSTMTVNFVLSNPSAKVVLAWSGHVAANLNPGSGGFWGAGNSIPSGSPYHFHAGFDQVSGGDSFTVGNQDLALASSAIVVPPHLTLIKTVTTDNGGTAVPTDWTLTATGPTPISG